MDDMPRLDRTARWLHAGLASFGLIAWLTGEIAGDADGFWFHAAAGLAAAGVLALRIIRGFSGPAEQRFSSWLPVTGAHWQRIAGDVRSLAALRLALRPVHYGLAGLVEACGLALFTWMGLTGIALFFGITPGAEPSGWLHTVEEAHEAGEFLVPLYLALHVGAALVHELQGHRLLRRMFG